MAAIHIFTVMCREAWTDLETGWPTLCGVVNCLGVDGFPGRTNPFCVVVRYLAEAGTDVALCITSSQSGWVVPLTDGLTPCPFDGDQAWMQVGWEADDGMTFPAPGRYHVEVVLDGRLAHAMPFDVVHRSLPAGPIPSFPD